MFSFGMCCYEMVAMQVPHHGYTQLRFAELMGRGQRPRMPGAPLELLVPFHPTLGTFPFHRLLDVFALFAFDGLA